MGNSTEKSPKHVSDSGKQGTVRSFLLSGCGVAVLSGAAYLTSYTYETGYAGFFGIPEQMIKLDLINVCISFSAIFVYLLMSFCIIDFAYMHWPANVGPIGRSLFRLLPIFIAIAVIGFVFEDWKILLSPVGGFLLGIIVIEFTFPLFQRGKTYREKLEAQEEVERNVKGLPDLMMRSPGGRTALISFALILFPLMIAGLAGTRQASKQEAFLMIHGEDDIVVLRIYGDRLICAPLDRAAKTVHRSIIIMESSPGKPLRLDSEKVGPLKLVPMMDKKQDAISNSEGGNTDHEADTDKPPPRR